jgi:hypothetical protein
MHALLIVLALAGYLGFLIDWREFGGVLRQGGWAGLAYLCLVGVIVAIVLANPHTASAPMAHH